MTSHQTEAEINVGESVVDEIRAIRKAIDTDAGHDLSRLVEQSRKVGERIRAAYGLTSAEVPAASDADRDIK